MKNGNLHISLYMCETHGRKAIVSYSSSRIVPSELMCCVKILDLVK